MAKGRTVIIRGVLVLVIRVERLFQRGVDSRMMVG